MFQQHLRGLEDLQFRFLPLDVDLVQLVGQFFGPVRVLAQHQLQGRDSAVHAARRIDAGRDGIADVLGRDGAARKAHFFQQSFQARAVGVLQLAQAGFYQRAVLAGQRHHVGHSAHGGKVAAIIQHFFRRAAVQRGAQLKSHTRAAQALEGAGVVQPAGVHHGNGFGQRFRRQMVVGDDEVDAQFCGKLRFFHSRDAVVHGHDELIALVVDGLDGVAGKAVAVALAAGQHAFHRGPHTLEVLVEQGRGGHAVHVVIAKDHDGLAVINGLPDALAGFLHIRQQKRVAEVFLPGQQGEGFGRVGDAPGGQDARQQGVLLLLGGKHAAVFCVRPGFFFHSLLFQFFHGLLGDGLRQLLQGRAVQRLELPCTVGH